MQYDAARQVHDVRSDHRQEGSREGEPTQLERRCLMAFTHVSEPDVAQRSICESAPSQVRDDLLPTTGTSSRSDTDEDTTIEQTTPGGQATAARTPSDGCPSDDHAHAQGSRQR